MIRRYLALLTLLPFFAGGQSIDSLALFNLTEAVARFQAGAQMRHGTLGLLLSVRESGEILLSANADKSFPPASTMKLVTTAAALEILGEDFTFQTYLEHDGILSNGVLKGNVYIRGTGDPSLGSPRFKDQTDSATVFNNWLKALQNMGIRQIEGKIVADVSYFDEHGAEDSWSWGDIGSAYGAGVSGLNWNENTYRIYFRPGARTGAPAVLLRTEPSLPGIRYINRVETGPAGAVADTRIRPSIIDNTVLVDGSIPRVRREYSIRGAVFNPGQLLADHFTGFLIRQNVPVRDKAAVWSPGKEGAERQLIYVYKSPPLPELCKQTNWWSVNLYADAMLKAIGKKMTGKTDFRSVAPAIVSFWALKGVNVSGMLIRDGSGLARAALLTPQNLIDILNKTAQFKSFPAFYESIPVAGESGTVRSRRFGNKLNVRAKSGSIEGTRTYAGFVNTRSGLHLSFVINANRYLQDATVEVTSELMGIVRLMSEL